MILSAYVVDIVWLSVWLIGWAIRFDSIRLELSLEIFSSLRSLTVTLRLRTTTHPTTINGKDRIGWTRESETRENSNECIEDRTVRQGGNRRAGAGGKKEEQSDEDPTCRQENRRLDDGKR